MQLLSTCYLLAVNSDAVSNFMELHALTLATRSYMLYTHVCVKPCSPVRAMMRYTSVSPAPLIKAYITFRENINTTNKGANVEG